MTSDDPLSAYSNKASIARSSSLTRRGGVPLRFALVLALTVAAQLLLARAVGATPSARLVYSRSNDVASCPDEESLRRAVAARVGYDPFAPEARRMVVANVTKRGRAFVASVNLVDDQGHTHGAHELRTESACAELLDAVALAIAIAIDPRLLLSATPAAPEPTKAPAESAPTAPPPPPSPSTSPSTSPSPSPSTSTLTSIPAPDIEPSPPSPRNVTLEASAGVVASNWVAPSLAVGLSVGAALRWRALSLGLEGRIDAPAGKDAQGGGTAYSWLVLGAIVPCAYIGPVFGCGIVQLGSMQASSAGVADSSQKSLLWSAAGGRIGVLVPLQENFLLRGRLDVVADLAHAELDLSGAKVWSAPPAAGSFGADAILRFR